MFKLCIFAAFLAVALAQFDGRYRPDRRLTIVNSGASDGRYRPSNDGRYSGSNDGRYSPDNSGRYSGNDGKYYPDDAGKYTHQDSKYKHQDNKYQHADIGGGQYTGDRDRFGSNTGAGAGSGAVAGTGVGSGSGSRFGAGGSGSSSSSGFGAGANRPSSFGSGISAAGGFGAPVAQKTGSAAGLYDNRNYAIIRQVGHVDEDGYHYLYETENGITGEEAGKLHNRDTEQEGMKAGGFYKYTGPDNVVYEVTYTADENGFQAQAAHIPTPPPIPELILRALEWQKQQGIL